MYSAVCSVRRCVVFYAPRRGARSRVEENQTYAHITCIVLCVRFGVALFFTRAAARRAKTGTEESLHQAQEGLSCWPQPGQRESLTDRMLGHQRRAPPQAEGRR